MLSIADLVGRGQRCAVRGEHRPKPYSAKVYDELVGQFTRLRDVVSEFFIAP